MSSAIFHLASQERKTHRCGIVTIGEHNGNILICLHQGYSHYWGRRNPAHVLMGVRGEIAELVQHAKNVPLIPKGTPYREQLQSEAIRQHFAAFEVPINYQDALTGVYFFEND